MRKWLILVVLLLLAAALAIFLILTGVLHAATVLNPGDIAVCTSPVPSPTATATATPPPPTPTPAPTPSPSCITITSPANGATVSGNVPLPTTNTCSGAWWESVDVDGVRATSGSVGECALDTLSLTNGQHTVTVNSQSQNPGSVVLGSDSVALDVENASPTPVPSASQTPIPPTPTAAPTSTPGPVACATTGSTLTINSSGDYDGTGKCVTNIVVNASNVTVHGYDVSNQSNNYGIWVKSGSNVVIENNKIHDLCKEGIWFNDAVSNSKILDNVIVHAAQSAIYIRGSGHEIARNDISDTTQYPRAEGGKFSSCQNVTNGADADCMRAFGSDHSVHDNYCHDIANDWGSARNKDPHVDCIQTWGPLRNLSFDHNRCIWNDVHTPETPTAKVYREFCQFEMLNGTTTSGITVAYNLFVNGHTGCQIRENITGSVIDHNTFVGTIVEAAEVYSPGNTISNNIGYDIDGSGGDAMWCAPPGNIVVNNNRFNPSGRYGTYCADYPETRLNPSFVHVGNGYQSYDDGDYHLQPNSPVPTLGAYPLTGATAEDVRPSPCARGGMQ